MESGGNRQWWIQRGKIRRKTENRSPRVILSGVSIVKAVVTGTTRGTSDDGKPAFDDPEGNGTRQNGRFMARVVYLEVYCEEKRRF